MPKRPSVILSICFVAASVIFTVWPSIDLAVSAWFFDDTEGFWLADNPVVSVVREGIRISLYLMPLAALAFLLLGLAGIRPWRVPTMLWGYIVALFLVGPLFLANMVLKENWGRARPNNVHEFGGEDTFSPALRWANECDTNCSFVSGEGSGATALAISLVFLAPFVLKNFPAKRRKKILGIALFAPAIGIFLRVAMGKHFLSDTVFAILLVLSVAALLYRVMQPLPKEVNSNVE